MKRIISLYLDGEEIALLKARGKNISELVRSYIAAELGTVNDQKIGTIEEKFQKSQLKIAEMTRELASLTAEKNQLLKQNEGLRRENRLLLEKNEENKRVVKWEEG